MKKNMKLSPPWYTYNNEIKALFELDPDIEVGDIYEVNNENFKVAMNICTTNPEKFLALNKVVKPVVEFGNVNLHVIIQDTSESSDKNPYIEIYSKLFESNPRVKDLKLCKDFADQEHLFVEFEPEVIQFYNDNINDFYGNYNGLAQDIAQKLFVDSTNPFIHFCTASLKEDIDNQ